MEVHTFYNGLDGCAIYCYSSIYIYGDLLSFTMDGRIIDGRDCLFRIKSTRILCDYIWKGVRSFFEQADSLFLISYPAHMQKLIQYGMTYTFIRIAITNVVVVVAMLPVLMKSIGVTEDTSRIILAILYCISIFVGVINEIYSCTCGKRWLLWIIKNVIFSISLSFFGLSLFLIYKNPWYSILSIGLTVFLIIILIKEKLNYKNCFLKKLREKKKKVCAGRVGLCKLVVIQLNRVVRIKRRGCFHVLKSFREEKGLSYC